MVDKKPRKILVTGGVGMIGSLLVSRLRDKYGNDAVIAADVRRKSETPVAEPFLLCDITNFEQLETIVTTHKIDWLFNMAAILSVSCEQNPQLAMKVNMQGFQNVIEVCRLHNVRIFTASTQATFGPSTPKLMAPDVTIQRPLSLYACTKVHNELIGEFYHRKFGVDFRCLRYPTVVTADGQSRGRVIDSVLQMFSAAVKTDHFTCDVGADTCLTYLLVDDTVTATIQLMEAPNDGLTLRTYNVASCSKTVGELKNEIQKLFPNFRVEFKPDTFKQAVLDSLPLSLDDSNARKDWSWQPFYGFEAMVKEVIARLQNTKN